VHPARDREAAALLCRRLAPRARLYGLRHLRDPHAASDLAQDVLVMTLLRLREGSIRNPGQIASFVLGACRQMIVDRRRGERRREELLAAYAEDLPLADAATIEPPAPGNLQGCLERLPERERSVLLMTFYDDSPADRIAQDLGVTAANVRVIRHRGLGRLRDCLRKAGDLS
jgi:RNA polymerase sigma-70 factor (ECF subfamily)